MESKDEGDKFLDRHFNYLVALYFTLVNTVYFMSISKIEPMMTVIEIIASMVLVNVLAAAVGFVAMLFIALILGD